MKINRAMLRIASILSFFLVVAIAATARSQEVGQLEPLPGQPSNQVRYQLPNSGPLPATYRVTLAIVDPKNPDWIISQFVSGEARTVTAENRGIFTEIWNGLDDNFMPAPPGKYAVKGIYMPASRWPIDGEFHSVTPKYLSAASSWASTAAQDEKPLPFGGDPCGAPLTDVKVGPNGIAVFYYQYLENGLNNPRIDLNKPIGFDQFVEAFPSGGAGGGSCTATDGRSPFGATAPTADRNMFIGPTANRLANWRGTARRDVYRPEGAVTALAAWRDPALRQSFLYIAERGKLIETPGRQFIESANEVVDTISVLDGDMGAVLARRRLPSPAGLVVRDGVLFALHGTEHGQAVSSVSLAAGKPQGDWRQVFAIPETRSGRSTWSWIAAAALI